MAAPDQPVPDPLQPPQVPDVDPKTFATIAAVVQAQVSQFISPLPDANILARYDQIVPGAAERILKLTEMVCYGFWIGARTLLPHSVHDPS